MNRLYSRNYRRVTCPTALYKALRTMFDTWARQGSHGNNAIKRTCRTEFVESLDDNGILQKIADQYGIDTYEAQYFIIDLLRSDEKQLIAIKEGEFIQSLLDNTNCKD